MANLIVCADDYAQSEAIDAAILALITQGKLTATSCLSLSPRWPHAALKITQQHRQLADIGLHLDFTQYAHHARYDHPQLILRALLRQLNPTHIRANISQQLDAFEAALQTPPDYVDGHLHVHQLPQIRDALLSILSARYGSLPVSQRPWLRIASPPLGSGVKARIIHYLGAQAFAEAAQRAGFACSPHLLGVYGFDDNAAGYFKRWHTWAQQAKHLSIHQIAAFAAVTASPSMRLLPPVLMCHPAQPSTMVDVTDPIAAARVVEWQVMQGRDFHAWLGTTGLVLVKGHSGASPLVQ